MSARFTHRGFLALLLFALGFCAAPAARAAYVPVAVTGYTADIVANGIGLPSSTSVSADVDSADNVFVAQDYSLAGVLYPYTYLPSDNRVYSVVTSGVVFQLAPYNGFNSLRLPNGTSGTLTLATPLAGSEVFLLATTGGGSSTDSITVTFTDASVRTFPSVPINDWFFASGFAIRGINRVNANTGSIDNNTTEPRLYEIKLTLDPSDLAKQIASVTVTVKSTNNAAAAVHIMGVTVNTVGGCTAPTAQPTALRLAAASTTSMTVSFNAAIPAADKYLVVRTDAGAALTATPVNGTPYAVNAALGNGTVVSTGTATSLTNTGLTANSLYRYTVFAYNDACVGGPVYNTTSSLTTSASTPVAPTYSDAPATGYNVDIVANGAGIPAVTGSANDSVDGAGFAFMAPDYSPAGTLTTVSLPASGLVSPSLRPGLTFQLQPYTAPNALRIPASATPTVKVGTLTLNTPISTNQLLLLATAGNGPDTATVRVTFTDASFQDIPGVIIPDWFFVNTDTAIRGIGRTSIITGAIDAPANNPRLYFIPLALADTNYSRLVASVTLTKTDAQGFTNVMGLATTNLALCNPPTAGPTGLTLTPLSTSVRVGFTGAEGGADRYLVVRTPAGAALNMSPVDGQFYTAGATLGNGTVVSVGSGNVVNDAGVVASTQYTYTVFAFNNQCGGGPLYNTASLLTGTATTGSGGAAIYTWTGATNFTYTTASNWNPARTVPAPDDILVFDNSATNAVYGVPTETIGRLMVMNNTTVYLQSSAGVTLTIASDNNAGTDELSVGAGSTLLCNGSAVSASSLTIAFSGTGATAAMAGTLEAYSLVAGTGGNNIFNFTNAIATVAAGGTLAMGGTNGTTSIQGTTAANLLVNGTLRYNYATTSPTMPTGTWNPGSLVLFSGYTSATTTTITGLNQTFQDFTYNCRSQTSTTVGWGGNGPTGIAGTFTMLSSGTGEIRLASTQTYNHQWNNYTQTGGTLSLSSSSSNGSLNISGSFNQTAGIFKSGSTSTTSQPTLHFNGTSSAQSVNFFDAAPGGRLIYRVSNPAGINLIGSGTLTSTFAINQYGGVRISTTASPAINTSLTFVYGASPTTLTYDAPAAQMMTALEYPAASGPSSLTIANPAVVTMPFSRTVPTTLTLTSGVLDAAGQTLMLGTSTSVRGALAYTAGTVIGTFVRWFTNATNSATGNTTGLFPMGRPGTGERRIAYVDFTAAPTAGGTLTAIVDSQALGTINLTLTPDGTPCPATPFNAVNRSGNYLTLTAGNGLAGGTYALRLRYQEPGYAPVACELGLAKRPNAAGAWAVEGVLDSAGISLTDAAVRHTGLITFSDFIIVGSAANPLPVAGLEISAVVEGMANRIQWSVLGVAAGDRFAVERSADAQDFSTLTYVTATGATRYSYLDAQPLAGAAYYRVRLTRADGSVGYSKIVSLRRSSAGTLALSVSPNPVADVARVKMQGTVPADAALVLTDVTGRVVLTQAITAAETAVDMSRMAAGTYILRIRAEGWSETVKVVKQ